MANFIPKIEYENPTLGTTTINFELPPVADPLNERLRSITRETKSGSGKSQSQFQYFNNQFRVSFSFITKAILDQYYTFFLDYAGKGSNEFKYFPSNDEADFLTCILSRPELRPRRIIRDGADFIYEFEIRFEVVN